MKKEIVEVNNIVFAHREEYEQLRHMEEYDRWRDYIQQEVKKQSEFVEKEPSKVDTILGALIACIIFGSVAYTFIDLLFGLN